MRNYLFTFAALVCFSACHRPIAYFQQTPRVAAARLSVNSSASHLADSSINSIPSGSPSTLGPADSDDVVASQTRQPDLRVASQVQRRLHHAQLLIASAARPALGQQPDPRPKKKLKLGNRIRQSLGMPLRKELNWWQRISWKLKASIIVILVALVFALVHVTILALIFGILGAFLLISGLKRSFKVKRPWF